jgi:hypothetical protein
MANPVVTATLPEALSSHVFGRFRNQSETVVRAAAPVAPAGSAARAPSAGADEAPFPDLAQRVREAGEW